MRFDRFESPALKEHGEGEVLIVIKAHQRLQTGAGEYRVVRHRLVVKRRDEQVAAVNGCEECRELVRGAVLPATDELRKPRVAFAVG